MSQPTILELARINTAIHYCDPPTLSIKPNILSHLGLPTNYTNTILGFGEDARPKPTLAANDKIHILSLDFE